MILRWICKMLASERRPSKVIEIEMFTDKAGKWRWRMRAANNEVLATSEAYSSHSKALQTAQLIRSSDFEIHEKH
jgi:uncharacterized protein YegP (UPF0339 family)